MTPFQKAVVRTSQAIFITLLLTGLFFRLFMAPEMVDVMQCQYRTPIQWQCVTFRVPVKEFIATVEQENDQLRKNQIPRRDGQ